MVRRCVHRATGNEFAVKIMEVTAERLSPEQLEEVREATRRETHILRQVAGHPHISEAAFPTPVSWPCPQPTSPDRHCLWASPPPSLPALTPLTERPASGCPLPLLVFPPAQCQCTAASRWKVEAVRSFPSPPLCLFPQSHSSIPMSLLASCSWCLTCEYPPAPAGVASSLPPCVTPPSSSPADTCFCSSQASVPLAHPSFLPR